MMMEKSGPCDLVLERPFTPFPIHELHLVSDLDIFFNRGRVPVTTWNKKILASNLRTSFESSGNSGFVTFSSKFLTTKGWEFLINHNGRAALQQQKNTRGEQVSQLVTIFSPEESGGEWGHGSFPLEEYIKALNRSKGELYYNHSLGMRYSKV